MIIIVKFLHHKATLDDVGFIPSFLSFDNPEPAKVQLHNNYSHGGGWKPFNGFKLGDDDSLSYPGDPAYLPIAEIQFREERIVIYSHGWVVIIQPDRSFEASRMD